MSNPIRVGLYGGTFDPIHKGHLHLIEQLFSLDIIDELVIVPTGQPWLRSSAPVASAEDRLAMVKLAVNELPQDLQPRVTVSDIEVRRSGPTYTIDTVLALQSNRPEVKWILLLGSDAYAQIDRWHRSAELREFIEILVIARAGEGLDIEALPISASQVRAQVRAQIQANSADVRDIPASVWTYIKERNLYASK